MQNRAAQFVDTVSRHLTAGCVLEAMGSALNDIGIDCFCMNLLATPKQKFEEVILAANCPQIGLICIRKRPIARTILRNAIANVSCVPTTGRMLLTIRSANPAHWKWSIAQATSVLELDLSFLSPAQPGTSAMSGWAAISFRY